MITQYPEIVIRLDNLEDDLNHNLRKALSSINKTMRIAGVARADRNVFLDEALSSNDVIDTLKGWVSLE